MYGYRFRRGVRRALCVRYGALTGVTERLRSIGGRLDGRTSGAQLVGASGRLLECNDRLSLVHAGCPEYIDGAIWMPTLRETQDGSIHPECQS